LGFSSDLELRYGRFINSSWLVGAAVDFRETKRFSQQAFGVFGRYYLNKQQKGFFIEGSYKVGVAEQTIIESSNDLVLDLTSGVMHQGFTGSGYTVMNKKNFGVEFFAGWETTKYNVSRIPTFGHVELDQGITTGIRFQFQFD